jgi:hypothetical protein
MVERNTLRLPPCSPDTVSHAIEKLRSLPQVGNGEWRGHLFLSGAACRSIVEQETCDGTSFAKKTIDSLDARMTYHDHRFD